MHAVSGSGRITARMATSILIVLTAINFVNYLDRYVLSAVLVPLSAELGIDDVKGGFLGTAFMWVYMVAAPLGGYFGDRMARKYLVAGGVMAHASMEGLSSPWPMGLTFGGGQLVAAAILRDLHLSQGDD